MTVSPSSTIQTTTSSMKLTSAEEHLVDFDTDDDSNPVNFSKQRKWIITSLACFFTVLVSASATSYNMGSPSMIKDLNCSNLQATLGLSMYALGFGLPPLVTSSLSEEFGRLPLYLISIIGFLLMHLMIALSTNIQAVAIGRLLQGAFGSTGATMVAGTITDIWSTSERGLPMAVFSLLAFGGNSLGAVAAGWVEMNAHLGWRWIQWIHLIIGGIYFFIFIIFLDETRSSVILRKRAQKLRKTTGDNRYIAASELITSSHKNLLWQSCMRPLQLLFTEPIVMAFSLWIGFAWGVYYCMIESIPGVFKTLHGFNTGQVGTIFITMLLGSMLGFLTNIAQEKLYQKYVSTKGPEARLYFSFLAAVLFPASMFLYAWTSTPENSWITLAVALTIYIWATFTIYLAVFAYLADCYGTYASSALAGQSLFRNIMAAIFPLFTDRLFRALGYTWANTIFACSAAAMMPIPVVLYIWGSRIRRRSRFSVA